MIPTIHYKLRTERPNSDGSAPIYIRVAFNRDQRISLAIGKSIPLRKEYTNLSPADIGKLPPETRYKFYNWDKDKERATKGFLGMEQINFFLDEERNRANRIIYDLGKSEKLTMENFRKEFLKQEYSSNEKFLDYCLKEINTSRSESISNETKRSYKAILTKLNAYKPGIRISDITYKFLVEYENYMIKPVKDGGAGNNKRTAANNLKIIRTFICIARKNGDLAEKDYPFKDFKVKDTEKYFTTRDFLEPEEILSLEKLYNSYVPLDKPVGHVSKYEWKEREEQGLLTPGEYKALRAFLIGVYTGLRFRDVYLLTTEEHLKSKEIFSPKTGGKVLKYYLDIDVHKTGVNVVIPLIDKALQLIDVNQSGKICETTANQTINGYLKSIQKKAKLDKVITFHVSRHSFATVAFEYGIPEKVVQSILGHQDKKFTQIYTHLSNKKLFFEMDKMNSGYSETEMLFNECAQEGNERMKERRRLLSKLQNLDEEKLNKMISFLELI